MNRYCIKCGKKLKQLIIKDEVEIGHIKFKCVNCGEWMASDEDDEIKFLLGENINLKSELDLVKERLITLEQRLG